MYRADFWTLWEKARVECSERTALKQVYYQGWNRPPAQVGCMRQVLGPGALGRPRGIGWRGRWEGASGWGIHVNPWLIHVNVWQNPLQYCKVISLQLIKINGKKIKKNKVESTCLLCFWQIYINDKGKGVTEHEMFGWCYRLNVHDFEQTPRDTEGQRNLTCCNSWGGLQRGGHDWGTEEQQQ